MLTFSLKDAKRKKLSNYDETNVTDYSGAKKVVVPWNTKRVEIVQEHTHVTINIMVCGMEVYYIQWSYTKPWTYMIIGLKVVQLGQNMQVVPVCGSTWTYLKYGFFQILQPHFEATRYPDDTVVLLGDNLASPFSPKVIEACKVKKMYLSPFLENAIHLTQSLDVAVFAPMKKSEERF